MQIKSLEKKIRSLESELKEKNVAIDAANTALELNQRAKSDADLIVDKVARNPSRAPTSAHRIMDQMHPIRFCATRNVHHFTSTVPSNPNLAPEF